jgi:tetratricopeptide (TPR) repeat protein
MKCYGVAFLCAIPLFAEPVLLLHDPGGNLLRQVPAVLRPEGKVLAAREALYGAASAVLLDDRGVLYQVLSITAEDRDSGVVELFVGRQAPAGPNTASQFATVATSGAHTAQAGQYRDSGGFGPVARLSCSGIGENSAPLYNEHGFLAGWHSVRMVDGQVLTFAIPMDRLTAGLTPIQPSGLADWDRRRKPEADEIYSKALAYVWAQDFDGAAFYWRKAREAEPENARTWYHLAFAEGKTGHSREKTRCFRKAIELQPGFAAAHYDLGIGLALAGDHDGAMNEVKALRLIDEGLSKRLEGFLGVMHTDELPVKKVPVRRTAV